MKKMILFLLIINLPGTSYSQVAGDSSYSDFANFLKSYISTIQEKRKDTIIVFFTEQPVTLKKSYSAGGSDYMVKAEKVNSLYPIDSSTIGKKYVINSQISFDDFLNFVIKDSAKTSLAKVGGSFAFVYMPIANWQQFYLDSLMGYDTLLIFPQIDILRFHNNSATHQRYFLECRYTKKTKFFVQRVIFIRNKTIQFFAQKDGGT
jgi:hypothetical protein